MKSQSAVRLLYVHQNYKSIDRKIILISLRRQPTATTALQLKSISQLLIPLICMCAAETYKILIVFGYPPGRWQAPRRAESS